MATEHDDLWQAIYDASPYNWPMPCEHFAHRQQGGWDVCAECETDGIYEAVTKHLAGRLLPPEGEVSDSPRGLGNAEYARRIAARLYRDLWQRKQGREATAAHARVLIEKELNAIAAEIWGPPTPPPVVSDTREKGTGDG